MNFSFCSLMIKPKRFRDLRSDFSLNTSKKLALRLSVGLNTPRRLAPQPIGKKKTKKQKFLCVLVCLFTRRFFLASDPGWRTSPWSAEEMLDEQHQRVDIPAHARIANTGLLQKTLEDDLC